MSVQIQGVGTQTAVVITRSASNTAEIIDGR